MAWAFVVCFVLAGVMVLVAWGRAATESPRRRTPVRDDGFWSWIPFLGGSDFGSGGNPHEDSSTQSHGHSTHVDTHHATPHGHADHSGGFDSGSGHGGFDSGASTGGGFDAGGSIGGDAGGGHR